MPLVKVEPGQKIKLAEIDPAGVANLTKDEAKAALAQNIKRMAKLQEVLYAEGKHALLIVLQAMDAGGKDGTVRSIMRGVNPQGVTVTGFKAPTVEELAHDFLWRVHRAVPGRGMIGIFNRSHYEDVLIVRVKNLAPKEVWQTRYQHINNFEQLLVDSGVTLLKFYLHISKKEQKKRLQARLDEPDKRWKFNPGDLAERARWDDYMHAFEDVFEKCSTKAAPWYIVPADKKWYRNAVLSETIVKTMESLEMKYPEPAAGLDKIIIE